MNGDRTLQLALASGGTTGGSFDQAMREILWRRSRLIFLIGIIASIVPVLLMLSYRIGPAVEADWAGWHVYLHFLHPVSFAAALLLVSVWARARELIQAITFWALALNLWLVILAFGAMFPDREPFMPVAMMLFVYAAFIPCRIAQVWLAGITMVAVLVAYLALPPVLPELAAYWTSIGSEAALFERLWIIVGVAMLAGVSIVISRTLHRLQRTAAKAERLGNYFIEEELGEGGMGKVYRARHAMIRRPTAVKVMSGDGPEHQAAVVRFEREVQLSASLTHPNTITIFDFGRTADNTFYYAMEYLGGMDLEKMILDFGPLPAERSVYLLIQALGSLGEAHQNGIIHRDIKPSNIFITQRGGAYDFVKVLDFGLAREVKPAEDGDITKAGMIFGTPRYIAPESVYGTHPADSRSDIYNLGGVAYWTLTGQHLFAGSNSLDLLIDHVKTVPPRPAEVSELEIPERLDQIVMKCLEKDPDDRYQTVRELEEDLRAIELLANWNGTKAQEWWSLHAPDAFTAPSSQDSIDPEERTA